MTRRWARQLRSGLAALAPCHLSFSVFFVFLGLYVVTLRPGLLPADSGEFQMVATTAGVAHPPGYPLHTMVGWLFSQLPLGPTPAWRVNVFSAVTAAATVAVVFSTARQITRSVLGGMATALALGSATTFWATATKASIRPLSAFFTALSLYALVRHTAQVQCQGDVGDDRYLVLFFLALSLGLTHHPSLAFPGFVFLTYLVLIDPALLRQPGRWLKPLVALLPSLLVLVYLPLRGAPRLATLSGFLDHVLARGFRGDMFALGVLDRLVLLPTLLSFQFNWALLLTMALGALLLLWRGRRLAFLLIGSFLVHTTVTLTYDAPQTVEYEIPAYVSLSLLVAVPFGRLAGVRARRSQLIPRLAGRGVTGDGTGSLLSVVLCVATIVLLVSPAVNLAAHYPSYRSLSRSRDTRRYVRTVLHKAPEGALVLSNWHWFTPLQYVQQVEGLRPDVTVEYVAPRGEPLAQTWVQAIEKHASEQPIIVVRYFEAEYSALPYVFEPLGEAFLVRSEPRLDVPADMVSLDVVLDAQIELLGYRRASQAIRPAQPLIVDVAWSAVEVPAEEVALFVQLIGPDGKLWSTAEDPRHAPDTLSAGGVVVDRFVLYPRLHALPGDYRLIVGAYTSGGRLTTPTGADAVVLEAVRLQPTVTRPVTQHPRFIRFVGGPTLIGVDHEAGADRGVRTYLHWAGPGEPVSLQVMGEGEAPVTESHVPALEQGQYATVAVDRPDSPFRLVVENRRWNLFFRGPIRLPVPKAGERYVPFGNAVVLTHVSGSPGCLEPGAEATISLRFRSQRALQRDYIVSTSLTALKTDGSWAWRASHDTVPALGAVPTLKWIRDTSILDPHRMRVPDDSPALPARGSLLIYDHFTQRSLLHLNERRTPILEIGTWPVSE